MPDPPDRSSSVGVTIYLARHGETAWNQEGRWQGRTDTLLHEQGRRQAVLLAERLREHRIVRVHTSDLARARETAEIVARRLGLPEPTPDPDLAERCFGVFEGLTREQCETQLGDVWRRYVADRRCLPPGAEPEPSVVERFRRAVLRAAHLLDGSGDAAALLVSHGSAIRCMLASLLGHPPPPVENASIVRLSVVDDALAVVAAPYHG